MKNTNTQNDKLTYYRSLAFEEILALPMEQYNEYLKLLSEESNKKFHETIRTAPKEEKVSIFEFNRTFKEYHTQMFSHWRISSLVEQEFILPQIINSDLFEDFILIDEVIVLHGLVRDECMRRLVRSLHEEV